MNVCATYVVVCYSTDHSQGTTALIIACQKEDIQSVSSLLSLGANYNLCTKVTLYTCAYMMHAFSYIL